MPWEAWWASITSFEFAMLLFGLFTAWETSGNLGTYSYSNSNIPAARWWPVCQHTQAAGLLNV